MNTKKRIANQLLFQGENRKEYFEGWYFKQVSKDNKTIISFIPGVSQTKEDPHAFVQIINTIDRSTYYIKYDMSDFHAQDHPFCIRIGKNEFRKDGIHIDIEDEIIIKGDFTFGPFTPIQISSYAPNIMGPFAYFPWMECIHAVISLRHKVQGSLQINERMVHFDDALGYLEKDYGISFPKRYIWIQSNATESCSSSFFFSYATIPFHLFSFQGLISVFEINGKQYRFATYYGAKMKKIEIRENMLELEMKQREMYLYVDLKYNHANPLKAPKKGKMNTSILESLEGIAHVRLYVRDALICDIKFYAVASEVNGDF